ncbi:MAG: hypothetical protein EA345_04605 [Halomonas sp.]|nr:sugar-transfer associated ATP-grasp domain-containing protein [Halomonas sp.]TVP50589.1 MAG: hypothetical protein EA345_04605 [Halomonas sp.]
MALAGIKQRVKQAAQRIQIERIHAQHRKMANALLVRIEGRKGALSSDTKQQATTYAHDVLGSRKYAPWLEVYAALSGNFVEGWIPGDYYQMIVLPAKNGPISQVTNTKTLTHRLLNTPALPDIAYLIDGIFYGRDYAVVDRLKIADLLFAKDERVFFKPDRSFQGKGIRILERTATRLDDLAAYPDGVFQRPIIQHGVLSALTPNSTATLRLTTAKGVGGNVELRAADLRLGRQQDSFVRAASEIRVPVDISTGVLWPQGYLPDWQAIESHPDTCVSFKEIAIPSFQKAVKLCCQLHQGFPHLGCIGWDIGVDQHEEIKIMEWNAKHNSIVFSEATTGPSFLGLGWEELWKQAYRNR